MDYLMPFLNNFLSAFLDTLTGHLALAAYLLAVTGERAVWKRLKKLPLLLLSPLIAALLAVLLYAFPIPNNSHYFILSFAILMMCTLWVRWVWRQSFWQALAITCMAAIFQVAGSTVSWMIVPLESGLLPFAAGICVHLGISIAASLLLCRLRFGKWFRLLLDSGAVAWRTALLLFALEADMEMLLQFASGVKDTFLPFYYLLVAVTVVLITVLVVFLAQRIDAAQKMRAQQDVIAQQRLYEYAHLLAQRRDPAELFTLRSGDMVRHVPLRDILFFETASIPHHVLLHTSHSRMDFLGSLNQLEAQLGDRFIRTHRAYLVAADKIEAVDLKHNRLWAGGYECLLSRAGKAALHKKRAGES